MFEVIGHPFVKTHTTKGREVNSDLRKGGCVDLVLTRGREGVQNLKNLADIICASPLRLRAEVSHTYFRSTCTLFQDKLVSKINVTQFS